MDFCERLKELRKNSQMTQGELAQALHIKQQTISQYEQGTSLPKDDIKLKLAKLFDVSIAYLMCYTDELSNADFSEDTIKLIQLFESLPLEKQKISIELLKALQNASAEGI